MTPDPWSRARNVLCVRLDALGDVLMTTPALRAVRESVAGRRLTLLTSSLGVEVAALAPQIDSVMTYNAPWMKATPPAACQRQDVAMVERLRREHFDAAIIFTVYSQSPMPAAMLCYLAGIPLRLAHCRENPYQLLTDWIVETEPQGQVRHEVRRQLDLVAAVGCTTSDDRMTVEVPAGARRSVRGLLDELGIDARQPWVVIHPGASAPSRRYPAEGFASAARRLVRESGWQVVFTGSRGERTLVDEIRRMMAAPSRSLAGRLSLPELAALLQDAPLLISNNTGPVHIAAAVGTPVVDLYALTNPQHTPWAVPHRVLFHDVECKYCYKSTCPAGHHDCLRRVEPAAIVQAARELLEGASHVSRVKRVS